MAVSEIWIAVIDDDAAVRNSLKFSLEVDGYMVRAFADADEFLQLGDAANCQCLIVDQHMPRQTGLELVAALRRRGVATPVLLMSGRVTPALTRQAMDAGVPIIEKPFVGNSLIEFIRAAVGGASN
jgi:FixJ family two-component response regulator